MKHIIFFLLMLTNALAQPDFRGLVLARSDWIGLGFYLAPYPQGKEPLTYPNCYTDKFNFMQLPYEQGAGKLYTAVEFQGKRLKLKDLQGKEIYCLEKEGYFPELVFYKDLLEARKHLLNQSVYAKKGIFYTKNAKNEVSEYKLKRFEKLQIKEVELCPISKESSVRFTIYTTDGLPGFVDLSYTAVNRPKSNLKIEDFFYLQNPKTEHNLNESDWQDVKNKKVSLGMSMAEVKLSLGEPRGRFELDEQVILVYHLRGGSYHHVFFKDRLIAVEHFLDDEIRK